MSRPTHPVTAIWRLHINNYGSLCKWQKWQNTSSKKRLLINAWEDDETSLQAKSFFKFNLNWNEVKWRYRHQTVIQEFIKKDLQAKTSSSGIADAVSGQRVRTSMTSSPQRQFCRCGRLSREREERGWGSDLPVESVTMTALVFSSGKYNP